MLGAGDPDRVRRMARAAGLDPDGGAGTLVVERPGLLLIGSSALLPRPEARGEAWMFSTATPDPAVLGAERPGGADPVSGAPDWERAARDADVAGVVRADDGTLTLHTGISGVQPVYVESGEEAVHFAAELNLLVETAPRRLTPDWTGWAQIIGIGAPLAGRTTVEGIARLGPMEGMRLAPGGAPRRIRAEWPWEQIAPEPGLDPRTLTGEVLDALREQLSGLRARPAQPMLSGGRDSRLLTGLAQELELGEEHGRPGEPGDPGRLTAWTTSSDTGTTLEELTAARIAAGRGLDHRIVTGRHDEFARDFADYARVTGFQASFHVWLMPVARELAQVPGTILDGLGGGVFLGGGFPDDPAVLEADPGPEQLVDARFSRLARYLQVADELLAPGVGSTLAARGREDFAAVAAPLAEHPQGATLTAYLTRTLPGISMAPAAVLGGSRPTAMPIMAHPVVSQALRVEPAAKRDGLWYPDLLRQVGPDLAEIPTAAELTTVRQHVRRGASLEVAAWYRELVLDSPAAALLGEKLRDGDAELWRRQLTRTRAQHLIRGLALLALWLRTYEDRLTETDPTALQEG